MRLIRVKLEKIKNKLYIKIPDLLAESLHLSQDDDIEISVHSQLTFAQGSLWGDNTSLEDIREIEFNISEDTYTLNKYKRLYVPEKYRFFLPMTNNGFILSTNVGNIRTKMTNNGYISSGLVRWFQINGPLCTDDQIAIRIINEKDHFFKLELNKAN